LQASSFYRSAPVDSSGPDYINAVAEVATTLTAPHLLAALQAIEQAAGRERPYVNAPRTLDLDLLLFGSARVASVLLTVPHPRMWERAFVLRPLHELAPWLVPNEALSAVAGQACALRASSGLVNPSATTQKCLQIHVNSLASKREQHAPKNP
jgi:2-amino-4-hydroxy-6-hydroxymethyldihydropteridine diphosphokinase